MVELWLSGSDGEGLRAVELVGGEAVEDVGEALRFGVLGGEVVGAVAAGYACAERGDDAVRGEGRERGGLVERDGLGFVERVGAEVEILLGLGCGEWSAGVDGGRVFELLIFAGEVADDADGGVDRAHGPARKAVEALPVGAEDALAEFVEELGRQERGASACRPCLRSGRAACR